MTRQETIHRLNQCLLDEMPEYRPQAAQFPQDEPGQRRLLRSLMNVRPPMPLRQDFLAMQDELLGPSQRPSSRLRTMPSPDGLRFAIGYSSFLSNISRARCSSSVSKE